MSQFIAGTTSQEGKGTFTSVNPRTKQAGDRLCGLPIHR
jgi:hypothetical protein